MVLQLAKWRRLRFAGDMASKDQLDLTRMNRAVFEALEPAQLVELTCRLHTMAMELSERLALNSTNSSRPPSSDPPFGGGGDATGSYVGRRDGGPSEGATPPGAKEGTVEKLGVRQPEPSRCEDRLRY